MSTLAVQDSSALEAALDALPEGTWIDITVPETFRLVVGQGRRVHLDNQTFASLQGMTALTEALAAFPDGTSVEVTRPQTFRVERVPGGWHLPHDLTVASADLAEGAPLSVVVFDVARP